MLGARPSWAPCLGLLRRLTLEATSPEAALARRLSTDAGEVLIGKAAGVEEGGAVVDALTFPTQARRTGVIAVKMGMTQDWDSYGAAVPLTVLWIDNCQVTQVRHLGEPGLTSLQVGIGSARRKHANNGQGESRERALAVSKRKLAEFRVTRDGALPVGTEIGAAHFKAGQFVDVTGTTTGKGFQGGMKRWGFAGAPASHGTSLAHRALGSTGACQDPGKVWKGKKMAGHMGVDRRTVHNCWLFKVDPQRNLLYVKGQVPGRRGNFVMVRDAIRKIQTDLPFPTFTGELPVPSTGVPEMDPYHLYQD
ncbi:unnamed protein product [Ostreobium quekettii]|uniref:Large ribosomal subunit protein uL3m n=1 Tax=Ostreobium quekettii TaxID=121088 RepID=A0A8S1IKF4_9CHLO|nr:unnamed protein product [Ostreobium quekettii]|eukprot:evm.model.scf_254EXC.5 EVM.evm.TU.scf_254EXC.5   scf_254EXC:17335-19045(-)